MTDTHELLYRRHDTRVFERSPGVQVRVSHLVAFPDDPANRRDYTEIREYNTEAEVWGHGILLPRELSGEVAESLAAVADDQ